MFGRGLLREYLRSIDPNSSMRKRYLFAAFGLLAVLVPFVFISFPPIKSFGFSLGEGRLFLTVAALAFLGSVVRPVWMFFLLLSLLPLEVISLGEEILPISLRPYQVLSVAIFAGIILRSWAKRGSIPPPSLQWFDSLPVMVAIGGVVSALGSANVSRSIFQAIVFLSFLLPFFLARYFLRDERDGRRVFPFVILGSIFSVLFAIWQGFRFSKGLLSFEAMPGRVDAFFPEPDWFGMFSLLPLSLACVAAAYILSKRNLNPSSRRPNPDLVFLLGIFGILTLSFLGLLLTVSRSAWISGAISILVFLFLLLFQNHSWKFSEWEWKNTMASGLLIFISLVSAVSLARGFNLTSFDLSNRARSGISGFQEITVSCNDVVLLPQTIRHNEELSSLGCRHIRLEEIESELISGRHISTVLRPDPSIDARRTARETVFREVGEHWFLGIGWGSIGGILGTDERGNAFNASNVFLEVWLGSGIIGAISFLVLWMAIPYLAIRGISYSGEFRDGNFVSMFFLVSWSGFTIFSLFNSGILLGFIWVWLGGIGMLPGAERSMRRRVNQSPNR